MKENKLFLAALVFILSFLMAMPAGAWERKRIICRNPEAQKLADQLYDMLIKEKSQANAKKAIELMEKASQIEPANDQLWIELSGDTWEYFDSLPKAAKPEQDIRLAGFNKGVAAAEKALAIKETAAANFWWACNKASAGEMIGIMKSIPIFPQLMKHSEKCDKMDPDYGIGATARFWSEVIARVPDIAVKAVGMKKEDAVIAIEAQIKKSPQYLNNYLFDARYMLRLNRKEDALKILDVCLKADPKAGKPEWYSENVVTQRDSKKLWKEITGKEYPAR